MGKRKIIMAAVLGVGALLAVASSLVARAASPGSVAACHGRGNVVFGTTFDSSAALRAWTVVQAPASQIHPNELQDYTTDAVSISHHALLITARRHAGGYTSGRLSTQNGCRFRYGRVQARIMTPSGAGLFPAFWLVDHGDHNELDVMEQVGRLPDMSYVSEYSARTRRHLGVSGRFARAWHTYGMVWGRRWITFTIDRRRVATIRNTVNVELYPVLNLAIGGPWAGAPLRKTRFPALMRVAWVRVYRLGR